MNVEILSQRLQNAPDKIIDILEGLGYENIKFTPHTNSLRFARESGRNPSSCVLNCGNLTYMIFSANQKGDLYSLIMDKRRCSFPEALKFAAVKAGFDTAALNIKIKRPFGGFYKNLVPSGKSNDILKVYPEETLLPYAGKYNMQFFQDGITFLTQEKYGIGYDFETDRITVPERSITGELIGIMGRSNDPLCSHETRWLPIIATSRSKTLFGYTNNYKHIVENGLVTLWESEKAVCQCDSFGSHNALATCGCHISDVQARYIKMLHPKKVIVAFDEGLEEEQVRHEAQKLMSNNHILQTKVGYVWDEASVVPEGSKMNLADLGKEAYREGLSKYVKWI